MSQKIPDALRSVKHAVAKFDHAASGNVSIIFGIAIIPLLLTVGSAVDYTTATQAKSRLQAAVDFGAVVAANNPSLTQPARQQLAQSTVLTNLGALAGEINPTITETEPSSGTYQVTATAAVPTSVMKFVHFSAINIGAKATAASSAPTNPNSVCMLALSQTASPGLLANSNVTINASACEIDVASTGNPAATFNSGDNFSIPKLCVAGTHILNNAGSISALSSGCAVANDPFAGRLPSVTVGACTVSNQNYSGTVSLSPGVYCGNFNFNGTGTLNLAAGLYILKGTSWNLNSGWTVNGSGVTFYFADTSYIQVNSGVTANLTAPTSGTYANILMFEPSGLPNSSFTINGQAGHSLQGLIYLPSRNITFNSMSNVTAEALTIVVNSVILDTLNWNIKSSAYVIPPAGTAAASAPRLVN